MKKVIAFLFVVFCFSSCKKCYDCYNPLAATAEGSIKVCSGSYEYAQVKKDGYITDKNGQEIHCY